MQKTLLEEEPRDRGHLMAELAANKADRINIEWTSNAINYLVSFLKTINKPFLVEDVRNYSITYGLEPPPDGRAWGHVIKLAQKNNLVETCGFRAANSSNGSPKVLWKKKEF